jgi:hypothetical protein
MHRKIQSANQILAKAIIPIHIRQVSSSNNGDGSVFLAAQFLGHPQALYAIAVASH